MLHTREKEILMYNMSDILQICCFQDASYVKDTVSHKVTFKGFKQVDVASR